MIIIEVARLVKEDGAHMIRLRKEDHIKGTDWQYDVKPLFTGNKRGWQVIDSFSASAILSVYNALNSENQARFNRIHINKLLDFCWQRLA